MQISLIRAAVGKISLIRGSAPPLGIATTANELLLSGQRVGVMPKYEDGSLGCKKEAEFQYWRRLNRSSGDRRGFTVPIL